ncbi:MAG: ATP-binding protein [Candidatus Marsarchaeota archaeon]|nr:ATP-binding protein [Candidatus Marsarchaeota archaeon]MCL5095030.1 ATP-binding protein [Candidatus Marsarchaeota archaeon]
MNLTYITNSKTLINSIPIERMSEPIIKNIEDYFNGIYLGKTKIYNIPFFLNLNLLTSPHIAVVGMTGAGKTYLIKNFIIRNDIYKKSNMLVIDLNGEYKEIAKLVSGKIYELGTDFKINLFEFLDNNKNNVIKNVLEIISSLIKINEKEHAIIYDQLIEYLKNGKIINLRTFLNEIDGEKFKIIKLKLKQLTESAIFADTTSFKIKNLFDGFVDIDLSKLETDLEKKTISYVLIRSISENLNKIKISQKIDNYIILDEAWKSLENIYLSRLFREGRKYGFSIIVASQLVSDINNVIISNSSSIFIFKIQNIEDFRVLNETGIADSTDIKKILDLNVGECFVYLSFKEENNGIKKFVIKKIDGLPLFKYNFTIGDKMEIEISKEKFNFITKSLRLDKELELRILDFIDENEKNINIMSFLNFLISLNLNRAIIISYLKQIGISDKDIISAYEKLKIISINLKNK